jgi:CubicO group peptidase (beta-lactamase class C family)
MAYALGGIAAHAGLFGTASDVARVLMPLVTGYFPGSAKVDSATLSLFTSRYFYGNRRGLLWDRPLQYSSQAKASRSFGHAGFTGTYCWVDPESGLILVFLSNRIHPRSEPNLLAKSNLRTDLWDLFYSNLKPNP